MLCIVSFLRSQENPKDTKSTSLYTANIDLNKGTADWAIGIASTVFDETIPEDQKTSEFYIFKQGQNLLVNQEIPLKTDNTEALKNCETLKKTCRSEQCVSDTLIGILGDGDRNVLIKYERKLLSVQIYYTYQDCQ
jgi:hypothetical protein